MLFFNSDEKRVYMRHLGHTNWRLISKLSKPKLVRVLPNDLSYKSNCFCETCQKGKLIKIPFKTKNIVSTATSLEPKHTFTTSRKIG